jgi:hypothetical protein
MDKATDFVAFALGFLDFVSKATPWFLLVGGLLVYYFREKVKQILARSLALDTETIRATLAKEHAAYSAQLQSGLPPIPRTHSIT